MSSPFAMTGPERKLASVCGSPGASIENTGSHERPCAAQSAAKPVMREPTCW